MVMGIYWLPFWRNGKADVLAGPPADVPAEVDATAAPADDATLQAAVAALKQSVAELRDEIASLRTTVEGLRAASGRNGG